MAKKGTVDSGKVTASVHVSTQWKACDKYGINECRKGLTNSIVTLLSPWWQFQQMGPQQVKDMMKIKVPAYISKPHAWSPYPLWPNSSRMTQGHYSIKPRFWSRDPLWPVSLRTVHSLCLLNLRTRSRPHFTSVYIQNAEKYLLNNSSLTARG